MKPTDQQNLILDYNGNSVVIAAPGSGKTFVLSQKIKHNLKSLLDHQGVIAISYTNKASNELKNRSLSNGEKPLGSFFGTIDKFNLSEIIIPFAKHLFGIPKNEIKIIKISSLSDEEQDELSWVDRSLTLEQLDKNRINAIQDYFNKGLILIETIGVFADYVFTKSIACQKYIKPKLSDSNFYVAGLPDTVVLILHFLKTFIGSDKFSCQSGLWPLKFVCFSGFL